MSFVFILDDKIQIQIPRQFSAKKMAAKLLNDVLNGFVPLESLYISLLKKNCDPKENIFDDEWSQAEFISYFLNFLREQSSRIFQSSCSVETPRKNSHLRMIKNLNITPDKASCLSKPKQKFTPNTSNLDLESLHSFPSLSSNSSKIKSLEKALNRTIVTTPIESPNRTRSKESSSLKKNRRVKLFSEQCENSNSRIEAEKSDVSLIEDQTKWLEKENKFTSTPKQNNKESMVVEYFNNIEQNKTSDLSPRWSGKSKWKKEGNRSAELIINDSRQNHSSSPVPKSKSFSSDTSYRSKDNKANSRASLGDFILNDMSPNDSKKDKKSRARKRINPTRVKSDESQLNSSSNDLFDDKAENLLEERMCVKDERQLLKKECASILEQFEGKMDLDVEKDVKIVKNILLPTNEADPTAVTFKKELTQLANVYSFLIDENFCQNIMMELCFIVSLLVVRDYNTKTIPDDLDDLSLSKEPAFLDTVHNCVYFAVEMLWLQQNTLKLLSKAGLKLLIENTHIGKFNPKLKDFLSQACSEREMKDNLKRQNAISKSGMQGNVSFQYETDNRENFTSDASFHSFRKQRDLFYNILAIWEANHLSTGWVFSIGLGSKIRSLLAVSSDPINLLHLARLFRSQLVMSCAENLSTEESNEDILQLLPSVDPDKISRLKARLTGSPKRQGPCPLPDFVGHQEFYKEFILSTAYSLFHEYLKNSLCDEILRLNETEFLTDLEDNDSCMDEHAQDRYLQCINVLRLLSKFLGFIEFLPYRSEKQFTDRILSLHCSVRQNLLPLFDLESCLKVAIANHKLTLTVPWIVSYLSMIDACSARLNSYQKVWRLLIAIYKNLKSWSSVVNCFYLKLILGWVFQLPNFPTDLFYNMVVDSKIELVVDFSNMTLNDQCRTGLDAYDLVEENVLYSVCPYLNEINVILRENMSLSVRHIRPVTTQDSSSITTQATKQLELRLEESFLHNQTSSTRKTIEFVTERVSSIGIKHLAHEVIPIIKDNALNDLKYCNPKNQKEAETEAETVSEKCHNELVAKCEEKLWVLCSARSEQAVRALLSNDLDNAVIETCTHIVIRQAAEKVIRWMQSHVTLAMIKREFVTIATKACSKRHQDFSNISGEANDSSYHNKSICTKDSHRLPPEGRGVAHLDEALPPSTILRDTRELIWNSAAKGTTRSDVENTLEEALKSVKYRDDMIPVVEKTLFYLVIDLLIVTCVYSETEIHSDTLSCFVRLLKHLDVGNYPNSSLERLVCARNVIMINQTAKNMETAWRSIGTVVLSFMDEGLLTHQQVETQLLAFLRHNWSRDEYVQMQKLVSRILEKYSDENGCDKFSLLLDLLVDLLKDV